MLNDLIKNDDESKYGGKESDWQAAIIAYGDKKVKAGKYKENYYQKALGYATGSKASALGSYPVTGKDCTISQNGATKKVEYPMEWYAVGRTNKVGSFLTEHFKDNAGRTHGCVHLVENYYNQISVKYCEGLLKENAYCGMLETVKFILKILMEINKVKENIHKIFENWNETIIWSCLQGTMGEIHTNVSEDAAMAILGDFAFYAGNPSEDLVKYKPESCKQDFIIMVPQNANWAEVIEKYYGNKAKKVTRYAIRKEMDIFDVGKLQQAVDSLQSGYVIKKIEGAEYNMCKENAWANDLVSQYKDYKAYKNFGLGIVVLKDGEVVAGASSYSRYDKGIEIEIDTREDHKRKGLAYACGAKLILECLEEGLHMGSIERKDMLRLV